MPQLTAPTVRHGRAADHFDYLDDAPATARDIVRGTYEDVIGPHVQTHRKEPQS